MDKDLTKIIEYYMEGSDNLYDISVVDLISQLLIEGSEFAGVIVKDGVEYAGICEFNKENQSVEIEREDDGIVTVQMPFTFKM